MISATATAKSEDTDKEPLLGFPVQDIRAAESEFAAVSLAATCEVNVPESMEVDTLSKKRKGNPISSSSLSDEKKNDSDDREQEARPKRPAVTRRKLTENPELEDSTQLSTRQDEQITKHPNKFWNKADGSQS